MQFGRQNGFRRRASIYYFRPNRGRGDVLGPTGVDSGAKSMFFALIADVAMFGVRRGVASGPMSMFFRPNRGRGAVQFRKDPRLSGRGLDVYLPTRRYGDVRAFTRLPIGGGWFLRSFVRKVMVAATNPPPHPAPLPAYRTREAASKGDTAGAPLEIWRGQTFLVSPIHDTSHMPSCASM